jgi:hypothetical protein
MVLVSTVIKSLSYKTIQQRYDVRIKKIILENTYLWIATAAVSAVGSTQLHHGNTVIVVTHKIHIKHTGFRPLAFGGRR